MINFTSNTSNHSDGNSLLGLIQPLLTVVGVGLFNYFRRPQREKPVEIQSIEELQQLLDSLINKCRLLTAINEHEEAYNFLLERQLESGVFELDEENNLKWNNELQELYGQLAHLDGPSFDLGEVSTLDINILNDIGEQTKVLNGLLEKNDEINLAGINIQKRQEIQISQKASKIQRLEKQHKLIRQPSTFFGSENIFKKSSLESELMDDSKNHQTLHS